MDILEKDIAKEVERFLKKKKKTKVWLYSQLGITQQSYYNRIERNNWKLTELNVLREIGII